MQITKYKGFTLIELLVVIAIISLLLSIIVPAIRMAKRKAASAVCLTNVKNLSLAWYMYQGENNSYIMSGNPDRPYAWAKHPERENGTACDLTAAFPPVTDEDEKRGIEKGIMYAYTGSFDLYHCPADNIRKSKYDGTTVFRTYAIPACLNGGSGQFIKKFSEITMPGQRYVFIEEAEGRNYNSGTWSLMTPAQLGAGKWEWQDPIGVNHGNSGILGFCDGHAEVHSWVDPHTRLRIEMFLKLPDVHFYGKLNEVYPRPADQVTDLEYISKGWSYQYR